MLRNFLLYTRLLQLCFIEESYLQTFDLVTDVKIKHFILSLNHSYEETYGCKGGGYISVLWLYCFIGNIKNRNK